MERPRARRRRTRWGSTDRVDLLGHVDEETKHAELASAWVALAPSVKEGWGLCVVEAASHGTPTVAYEGAGGLSESIVDGRTGRPGDDLDAMTAAVDRLLRDATASATRSAGRSRALPAVHVVAHDRVVGVAARRPCRGLPLESGTDAIVTPVTRRQRIGGRSAAVVEELVRRQDDLLALDDGDPS